MVESEKTRRAESAHGHVEPGELIKEVVDVKARLERIGKLKDGKAGREKLVNAVLQGVGERSGSAPEQTNDSSKDKAEKDEKDEEGSKPPLEVRDIAEIDRRLGELERAVGSASTAADEVRPPYSS